MIRTSQQTGPGEIPKQSFLQHCCRVNRWQPFASNPQGQDMLRAMATIEASWLISRPAGQARVVPSGALP
jgi:hypothetical protein